MYERFTDRARMTLMLANREAQSLGHESIATEHVLLGLLKSGGGTAEQVLAALDVGLSNIREEVENHINAGPRMQTAALPATPAVKKVVEYSMEEARNMNHNYVGTEHLLLGLLREQDGVAAQVLLTVGLTLDDTRRKVTELLGKE